MKIGIDIDGIIADFVSYFLPKLNKYCKCSFSDIVNYDFEKNIDINKEDIKKLWEECDKYKIYKELKIVKGSVGALKKLVKKHDIILITSRHKKHKKDTLHWLKKNEIKFTKLMMASDIKEKVNMMSKCDLVIEDSLEVARMVEAREIPVLLFDYPWNKIGQRIKRIRSWEQVLKEVK